MALTLPPSQPAPSAALRLLESISDAVILFDPDWRFAYLNPRAVADTGEPAHALLGWTLWEKYPALVGTDVEANFRRAVAEQTATHFETRGIVSGKWLEVHAYPSAEGLLVYGRDVSDRKRAEDALAHSEALFRQLAENIREVLWMADATARRVLYVSPAYEGVWGRTCRSLYERPLSWLEGVHPEDRGRLRDRLGELVATGGPFQEEYRVVHPDGSVRWVWDRAFPVPDERGRTARLVGIAEDVTER
jgi:PAS domain S-box-containing protein